MAVIKISELPIITSGSITNTDILAIVNGTTTYGIDVENLRLRMLDGYTITSASFDSGSNTQVPVSSEIYQMIVSTSAVSNEIYISSSQTLDNSDYSEILVTTDSTPVILTLSNLTDGNNTTITKIDSGSSYVRISSSYVDNTILDETHFDLYYQYECVNLKYNSGSSNYILV
jgi:hypothetical protein